MRLISNEELMVVAGGESLTSRENDGEPTEKSVELDSYSFQGWPSQQETMYPGDGQMCPNGYKPTDITVERKVSTQTAGISYSSDKGLSINLSTSDQTPQANYTFKCIEK